jgi:hypothetical protein
MGASSFINEMQIKHAGALLEDIQQYHNVYAFYLQAQSGRERLNTSIEACEGLACTEVAYNQYRTTGQPIAEPGSYTFQHQIMSGLIGPQNQQYVPLCDESFWRPNVHTNKAELRRESRDVAYISGVSDINSPFGAGLGLYRVK